MNESQARQLGRLITSKRMSEQLSLRELQRRTGITLSWLSKLEMGVYRRPSIDRLISIGAVLEIDPGEFNAVTGGYLAARLPSLRTYFRAKHGTGHSRIDEIERLIKGHDEE